MDAESESRPSTIIPFEGVFNCRDVGKTINTFLGRKALREGVFYRSGRLDEATSADVDTLKSQLHISSVIDLRSSTEHERRNMPSAPRAPPDSGILSDRQSIIPHGIRTHDIPFPSQSFYFKAIFPQLSWLQLLVVIFLYIIRVKGPVTRIVIRSAIEPLGLRGLARKWLEFCGPEIKVAMDVFASSPSNSALSSSDDDYGALKKDLAEDTESSIASEKIAESTEEKSQASREDSNFPVLIHCTQGKDRTGLITLLILMLLLGTTMEAQDAMEFDYAMSNVGVAPMREKMLKEMREVGFRDGGAFADAPRTWVGHIIGHIEEKWGGVEAYLESIEVGKEQMDRIRRNLLVMEDDDDVVII